MVYIKQQQILTSGSVLSLACLTTVLCMCMITVITFFFKNSGTQLIKKAVPTPLKTLSQTTNAVTSTVQSPAVIQVGGKIHCTMKEVIERTEENIDVFLLFLTLIWFSLR